MNNTSDMLRARRGGPRQQRRYIHKNPGPARQRDQGASPSGWWELRASTPMVTLAGDGRRGHHLHPRRDLDSDIISRLKIHQTVAHLLNLRWLERRHRPQLTRMKTPRRSDAVARFRLELAGGGARQQAPRLRPVWSSESTKCHRHARRGSSLCSMFCYTSNPMTQYGSPRPTHAQGGRPAMIDHLID